jgi:hypothetical protein
VLVLMDLGLVVMLLAHACPPATRWTADQRVSGSLRRPRRHLPIGTATTPA